MCVCVRGSILALFSMLIVWNVVLAPVPASSTAAMQTAWDFVIHCIDCVVITLSYLCVCACMHACVHMLVCVSVSVCNFTSKHYIV